MTHVLIELLVIHSKIWNRLTICKLINDVEIELEMQECNNLNHLTV